MKDSWPMGRKEQAWAAEHQRMLGKSLLQELPNQNVSRGHTCRSQMEQANIGKL